MNLPDELAGDSTNAWDHLRLGLRSFGQKLEARKAAKVTDFRRPFSTWKRPHIGKIRPLLLLQIFELMEWKWSYFSISRLFSCRKLPLKIGDFDSFVRLEFLTKWPQTKPQVVSNMSTTTSQLVRGINFIWPALAGTYLFGEYRMCHFPLEVMWWQWIEELEQTVDDVSRKEM